MTTTMMMEASSPLAAMQPPSFLGHYGYRQNTGSSAYASYAPRTLAPNSFNFRDLSMKRSHPDYFNLPPPVRGSSPTASLAADLSQNFHIDQSPQLPTPRRALFAGTAMYHRGWPTQNLKADTSIDPRADAVTTPPVPSSPVPSTDGMDMSPLPHKIPFSSNYEIQLRSPSPDSTPTESPIESMPSSATSIESTEVLTLQLPTERRRSGPLRPSLARSKGFSTNSIPQRPSLESQLPPFKFGSGVSRPATSSSLGLSEIFEESPVLERSVSRLSGPVMPPPRIRQPFNVGNNSRTNSPSHHVRKSSNPTFRPRKQFRRSLSMFEHPNDIMRQEKDSVSPPMPLIKDIEAPYIPLLPHFISDNQTCDLPRITKETMIEVLDGKYDQLYNKRVVIDCRFEYEYEGGHIDGAVNFNDKEQLAAQLFDRELTSKALLIFHCEYSAHRAPLMAKFIRNKDRMVNADRYPNLTYPEAYILEGGYSSFFKDYRERCFPQNYVEMDAKEHERACELGLGKVKQRSKLIRAQTFAFGQHSPDLVSSPTAMVRRCKDDDIDMDLGADFTPVAPRPTFDVIRGRPARMFSY